MEITISPPNPIIFVLDPSSTTVNVPDYIAGNIIAFTESCISVGIQADVDGKTIVKLETKITENNHARMRKVFDGTITTPGKKIALVTAEFEDVIKQSVMGVNTTVEIWVDDDVNPREVLVVTGPVTVPVLHPNDP